MALTQAQIDKIFADLVNEILRASNGAAITLTKTELKQAITDTNTWIDNNQASYNSALAVNVRTTLSTAQKALLFELVATKKYLG